MSEDWQELSRTITIKGRYRTDGTLVTVEADFGGSKSTQIGGSPPESIAGLMLGELAKKKKLGLMR
jgi:hypothetical protein